MTEEFILTVVKIEGLGDVSRSECVLELDEKQRSLIEQFAKLRKEDNNSISLRHIKEASMESTNFFQRHFGKRR